MEYYIIRHGETDWNVRQLLQGREDIPLNENGVCQADKCGKVLSGRLEVSRVITSPLVRAKRTAEIIAGYIGINDIIVEPDLIERDFGSLSGTAVANIFDVINGGDIEPVMDTGNRILDVLKKYSDLPGERSLVVSHGAAISAALYILSNGEIGTGKTKLKNTSVTIIDVEGMDISIKDFNLDVELLKL